MLQVRNSQNVNNRQETPYVDHVRIRTFADAGLSAKQVCTKLPHLAQSTVYHLYKKYKDTGSIEFVRRPGRPKITSSQDDADILRVALQN
jgi:transposase